VNAKRRADIRKEVLESQTGAAAAATASFETVAAALLATEPSAVEDAKWIHPESDQAVAKASSGEPGIAVPADFPQVAADTAPDPAVMEAGKIGFNLCMACHGPDGEGTQLVGPPLAKSNWVNGPAENLIAIQLRGLTGPIEVSGQTYTFIAPMVPQAFQTDEQIAAVLTYVRNSFGNKATPVSPEQVKALRGEVGKPMLTQADLIPPQ
jgi:mono/diheme cytochrome c family protein